MRDGPHPQGWDYHSSRFVAEAKSVSLSNKNILKPRAYFYDEANGTTDDPGIGYTEGFLVLNDPISFQSRETRNVSRESVDRNGKAIFRESL